MSENEFEEPQLCEESKKSAIDSEAYLHVGDFDGSDKESIGSGNQNLRKILGLVPSCTEDCFTPEPDQDHKILKVITSAVNTELGAEFSDEVEMIIKKTRGVLTLEMFDNIIRPKNKPVMDIIRRELRCLAQIKEKNELTPSEQSKEKDDYFTVASMLVSCLVDENVDAATLERLLKLKLLKKDY